jgi:hypothetical protein
VRDSGFDQTRWSSGGDHDLEAEHDGREPGLEWTPQEAARLCPYDSRGLEQVLEGYDDEREHALTDDNGIADSGGADEFNDQHMAKFAFGAERERTNPAQAARDLLVKHGLSKPAAPPNGG